MSIIIVRRGLQGSRGLVGDAHPASITVANNIVDVVAVADDMTDVNTVAAADTNITTVVTNLTDIVSVADNMTDVNSVATNMSDINDCIINLAAIIAAPDEAAAAAISAASTTFYYGTTGGSANAYTLTTGSSLTLAAGQSYRFIANHLSNGNVTLDVDGNGAKAILAEGLFQLPPYKVKNTQVITVTYDGTQFQPLDFGPCTGDIEMWSSSTTKPGWLLLNGTSTIGSATSGATFAGPEYEGLWKHLYDATDDTEAAVSGGRTTRDADWTDNETLTLPETDDKSPYGIGSLLTKGFKTSGATTVLSTGSLSMNSITLSEANLPSSVTMSVPTADVNDAGTSRLARALTNNQASTSISMTSVGSGSSFTPVGSYTGNSTSVMQPVFGTYYIIKI